MSIERNESTPYCRAVWSAVDRCAANTPDAQRERGRALREDVETVVSWLLDWWPGLEDGMPWPDNEDHEVVQAARRIERKLEGISELRARTTRPE